jgi:L-rhamnose mutarotase
MGRLLFHLRLYPGTETAFDGAHDPVPDDLTAAVSEGGLRNVSVFPITDDQGGLFTAPEVLHID